MSRQQAVRAVKRTSRTQPRDRSGGVRVIAVLFVSLCLSGCTSLFSSSPFVKAPHWNVELSSLDHVALKWTPGSLITKDSPRTILLELMGNGYLTLVSGGGTTVNDPFADAREGRAPNDEKRDQIVLSEAQTEQFFQHLVNTGFYEGKFKLSGGKNHTGPTLLVFAKINGRKLIQTTDDPEMMRLFRVLLKAF